MKSSCPNLHRKTGTGSHNIKLDKTSWTKVIKVHCTVVSNCSGTVLCKTNWTQTLINGRSVLLPKDPRQNYALYSPTFFSTAIKKAFNDHFNRRFYRNKGLNIKAVFSAQMFLYVT